MLARGEAVRRNRGFALSSPFHKFGLVYLDLEAGWTIGNFGHGMPCPPALARNVSVFMKWSTKPAFLAR